VGFENVGLQRGRRPSGELRLPARAPRLRRAPARRPHPRRVPGVRLQRAGGSAARFERVPRRPRTRARCGCGAAQGALGPTRAGSPPRRRCRARTPRPCAHPGRHGAAAMAAAAAAATAVTAAAAAQERLSCYAARVLMSSTAAFPPPAAEHAPKKKPELRHAQQRLQRCIQVEWTCKCCAG
jgi:hypothetical protein